MSCGGRIGSSNTPIGFLSGESAPARPSRLERLLVKLGAMFVATRRRHIAIELDKIRQRKILLQLDDRLLKDIGLTREQAELEGGKAFWE